MPKGGVSGITQAQLNAAVQAALESPENFTVIKEANEAAIIAAGGGGGGSSLVFPDLVVSGSGPYVVPAGFNAIVRVSCRGDDVFTINGFQSLGDSANKMTHINIIGNPNPTNSYTIPQNRMGTFYMGYGGRGGSSGQAYSTVNTLNYKVIGNVSIPSGDNQSTLVDFAVAGGDVLGFIRTNGSVTSYITGTHWPIGQDSSESQTYMIPSQSLNPPNVFPYPQTVIDGGSERVVELYAI